MAKQHIIKPETNVNEALTLVVEYAVARAHYEKHLTTESLKTAIDARDRLLAISAL